MTQQLLVIALAIVPALLIVQYFAWRDAYPEPPGIVWKTFGLGMLVTLPIGIGGALLAAVFREALGGVARAAALAFIGAALIEELGKFCVLRYVAARHQAFDEPLDGIVYGVAASVGFAALENILYVADGGMQVAIMRALTAIPGHAMFGVLMGTQFGMAHFNPQERPRLMRRALLLPIFFHGLYDFPLMLSDGMPDLAAPAAIVSVLVLIIGLLLARGGHKRALAFQASRLPHHAAALMVPPWTLKRVAGVVLTTLGGAICTSGFGIGVLGVVTWVEGGVEGNASIEGMLVVLIVGALVLALGAWLFRRGVRQALRVGD